MIFYLLVLLILLYTIFGNPFRPAREQYEFLTVDSETGDLTIVDSSTSLVAMDGGGLKSKGNFGVDGDLNVSTNLIASGNVTVAGDLSVTGKYTGPVTVNGTLNTTNNITSEGKVDATESLCVQGTCLTADTINWLNTLKAGGVKAVDNTLCLGDKCFNATHFMMLRGEADVYLNGNNTVTGGTIAVDGTYNNGHNIRYETSKPGDHNKWRFLSSW